MKKALLLLLIFCMVFPLSACGKEDQPAASTTENQPDGSESSGVSDPYLDSLPKKDYDLYEFKILCTTQTAPFYIVEDEGESVSASVGKRNLAVEDRYNIAIKYVPMDGNFSGQKEFNTALKNSAVAGSDGFDLVVGQQYYCLSVATEGKLYDLSESPYIHWDEKWYSQKINDNAAVNGKIYGASGSFIMSQISYALATLYCKETWDAMEIEDDLYQMVRDKKWTYEKLYQYAANIYEDTDHSGTRSLGDKYGYVHNNHGIAASLAASNTPITSKNEDGKPTILNYYNEHLLDVFNSYSTFYNDSLGVLNVNKAGHLGDPADLLLGGLGLFACDRLGVFHENAQLKNSELHFGLLPMPLYDENQDEYFTYTMRWELFYIPVNADFERSAIILENLNYETENHVIPIYWDEALTLRAADTAQDSEMMYIVKDALWYDFITFFNHEVPLRDAVASQIVNGATRLSSWWGSNKKQFEQKLQEVLEKYGADN